MPSDIVRVPVVGRFPVTGRFPVEGICERFPVEKNQMAELLGKDKNLPLFFHTVYAETLHDLVSKMVFSLSWKYARDPRHDINDLSQDCWLKVFSKLHTYSASRGAFTTWCWWVCSSVLNSKYRNIQRREFIVNLPEDFDEGRVPDTRQDHDQLSSEIFTAVCELKISHPEHASIIAAIFDGGDGHIPTSVKPKKIALRLGVKERLVSKVYNKIVRPFFVLRFKQGEEKCQN